MKLKLLNKGAGYSAILLQLLCFVVPTQDTGRLLKFEVPWLFKKLSDIEVVERLFVPLAETAFFKLIKKAADTAKLAPKKQAAAAAVLSVVGNLWCLGVAGVAMGHGAMGCRPHHTVLYISPG